ncbi:hypothetical protein TREMEDRAFT_34104 [Tremella mesenterica DSM 1558]|nr:uncharacterized protein TREMEDRAFT_34104 [Tremella mesenterica DSM 1558]EIW66890.1 hypothetical protein TREMEDRAFT_34104 [Tremella mesenterica DSM 1558]
MSKRDSNELNHLNGNGVHDRIIGNPYLAPEDPRHVAPIYSLDTPSPYYRSLSPSPGRVPSPNVFALPSLSLPSLSTIRFISLCFLWYSSSALSSNTGKVILNNFRYPVTLTIVQFFFVAAYCYICSRPVLGWAGRLRSPSKAILRGTLPMAAFQVGGHIFSSLAISRVPVSTVHTIKALSPLFTVFAYALLFSVSYSPATYLSLLPLTLGVMLACSFDMSLSNVFGIICAFGSTLVFVSQNIFFKKIMPTNSESTTGSGIPSRLDKINLLYFSSGTAFLLMIPLWLYSDARRIVDGWLHPALSLSPGPSVPLYFFLNGTVHFAQNLLAFAILSSTSPVTYSIASLVKRIAVICMAIVWFKQTVHPIQALGIALTGVGLWMYNNAKRDVEKGEKKFRQAEAVRDGVLPLNKTDQRVLEGRSEVLFTKEVHSSPRPMYPPNFQHMSKSSAVRPTAFALPPPVIPVPSKQGVSDRSLHIIPQEPPYPSPPASTASSPPAPPIMESHTRQRNMSIDRQDSDFHLPSAVTRSENIEEETHSKSHILSPPIISAGA